MLTCSVNKKCQRMAFRFAVGVIFDAQSERQLGVPLLFVCWFFFYFFFRCQFPVARHGSIEATSKWL